MLSLRDVRKARGVTQAELGVLAGVTQSMIAHVEAGRHQLSMESKIRIMRGLELSIPEAKQVQEFRVKPPEEPLVEKLRRDPDIGEFFEDPDLAGLVFYRCGHPRTRANTYKWKRSGPKCAECFADKMRAYMRKYRIEHPDYLTGRSRQEKAKYYLAMMNDPEYRERRKVTHARARTKFMEEQVKAKAYDAILEDPTVLLREEKSA